MWMDRTCEPCEGNVKGLTMNGLQFIILNDVLYYEWSLYVGAKIIMDGGCKICASCRRA